MRAAYALLIACVMWGAIATAASGGGSLAGSTDITASILAYHRFGSIATDAMTVRTSTFRSQLQYLKDHNHPVIPLRTMVLFLLRQGPPPPLRSVVITVDDGHRSVFEEMAPLAREFDVPVTLFVYPSAISNASYAMTWEQLDALHRTGRFDIQSHTYWHPNFKVEKRRLSPAAYRAFVTTQFMKPRALFAQKLQVDADLLAWPFGIYDDELIDAAHDCGYLAGFTLERRAVMPDARIMALPRFLVSDSDVGRRFAALLPQDPPP